jgi:hypothetical protein
MAGLFVALALGLKTSLAVIALVIVFGAVTRTRRCV